MNSTHINRCHTQASSLHECLWACRQPPASLLGPPVLAASWGLSDLSRCTSEGLDSLG